MITETGLVPQKIHIHLDRWVVDSFVPCMVYGFEEIPCYTVIQTHYWHQTDFGKWKGGLMDKFVTDEPQEVIERPGQYFPIALEAIRNAVDAYDNLLADEIEKLRIKAHKLENILNESLNRALEVPHGC